MTDMRVQRGVTLPETPESSEHQETREGNMVPLRTEYALDPVAKLAGDVLKLCFAETNFMFIISFLGSIASLSPLMSVCRSVGWSVSLVIIP